MNDQPSLQKNLQQFIGPEWISSRAGQGGSKFMYLEGSTAINLANEVFGYNGWSSELKNSNVDFCDKLPDGRYNVGISTTVRISLKDGTFHEDVGFGHSENCKYKHSAFEKARKQAATDGMKRALRKFGNAVGNCLYDKTYLRNVGNMSRPSIPFLPFDLYRHPQIRKSLQDQMTKSSESLRAIKPAYPSPNSSVATTSTNQLQQQQQQPAATGTAINSTSHNHVAGPSSRTSSLPTDDKNDEATSAKRQLDDDLGNKVYDEDSFFLDDEDDEFYAQIADYQSMPISPPLTNTDNPPSTANGQTSKRQRQ